MFQSRKFGRKIFRLKLPARTLLLGERTLVMGVLNVTPDSFSDGGVYFDKDSAVARALEIEKAGADILDIGGESTRPGSAAISAEEELRRVLPVLEKLRGLLKIPISIDTSKGEVAEAAAVAGAEILNDVSALRGPGCDHDFQTAAPGTDPRFASPIEADNYVNPAVLEIESVCSALCAEPNHCARFSLQPTQIGLLVRVNMRGQILLANAFGVSCLAYPR